MNNFELIFGQEKEGNIYFSPLRIQLNYFSYFTHASCYFIYYKSNIYCFVKISVQKHEKKLI